MPIPVYKRLLRRFPPRSLATVGALLIFGCLMIGIIAGSGYAGMRVGETDKNERLVSTANAYVIERYERGIDLFRNGRYALAAANFQEVLKYRPDYSAVRPLLATAQAAQTPRPATPTPTATPLITDKPQLVQLIKDADAQEQWDTVVLLSDQLRDVDRTFEADTVNELRYKALVNRGLQRIRGTEIEAGLYDLDQAAEIQSLSRTVENERASAAAYRNAMSYFGADWEKTIEMLGQLSPAYRDVGAKLYEANVRAGDAYSATHEYCPAQTRFAEALSLAGKSLAKLERKRADVTQLCALATPTSGITGTVVAGGTPGSATPGGATPGAINSAGVSGRILFNLYDSNVGYSPLHILSSSGVVIAGGGYQPAYQPSAGGVALNGGSSLLAWYVNGGSGSLTNVAGYWPSLSPDGGRVAYGGADGYIYIARVDNSVAPITLTQGSWPVWGPTGQIAYQGCTDVCGIHVLNPDNPSERRRLTTSSADVNMQWSPSGNEIVYASSYSGAWEIYVISLAGSFRQLTSFGASSSTPVFSPDGSRVAFESNRDGSWGIYTVNGDGGNLQKVFDLGSAHASWQSDRLTWVP